MDARGIANPCCKFNNTKQYNIPTIYELDTLNGLHSLPEYLRLRHDIENNNKPISCKNCWRPEEHGLESRRQEIFKHYKLEDVHPGYVQDMEIALDYTCNMMCRICGPHSSSKWSAAKDVVDKLNALGADNVKHQNNTSLTYQKAFKRVMDNTDLSYARIIRLQGGETFYSKNLEWFIDKLYREVKEPDKLQLYIFTNCSIFPSEDILNKILYFSNPCITASIDGTDALADVTRWGISWNDVSDNCKRWSDVKAKHSNLKLHVNSTVSLLNVNKVQDTLEFFRNLNFNVSLNRLHNPNYLSVYMVPKDIRSRWLLDESDSKYSNTIKQHNKHLMSDIITKNEFKIFLETTKILDQYQNNSLALVNKEIYNLARELEVKDV